MTIVVTGGGSGGHITPILAVADEIKHLQPGVRVVYIGQKGDSLGDIPASHESIDEVKTVQAGKLRRYHGEGWRQLLDLKQMYLNIRDMFRVLIGIWQSYWLLRDLHPDVVFVKGGFVGLPVGLAAAALHIPYVTHDSDALPGLTNRVIARWAQLHAVALPKEIYSYPAAKTITVGVPISRKYRPYSAEQRAETLRKLGVLESQRILLVTGGGLGAQRLNEAIIDCADDLLQRYPELVLVHVAGRQNIHNVRQEYKKRLTKEQGSRVRVEGFVTNQFDYSGVADVVVTRAGGNSMAEFAAQAKACVVVPNPLLTGGHQLKNAKVLSDRKAIRLVQEDVLNDDHGALMPALVDLLDHESKRQDLGQRLATFAQPDAAKKLAMLLLKQAGLS